MTKITQGRGTTRPRCNPAWLEIEEEGTRLLFQGHFRHRFTSRIDLYVDDKLVELGREQVLSLRDWLTDWLDRI
jgi:hypothetical protein